MRLGGAVVAERTRVTGVLTEAGEVRGVRTDRGDVEAEVVGQVTSAAWGAAVGLVYVADSSATAATSADWVRSGSYKVDVGGDLVPVRVGLRPPYDPENLRVRD